MSLKRAFKKQARDEEGSATVEFVLAVPLLLLALFIGFFSFHAFLQFSRASKAHYTVSDIISRYQIMDAEDVVQLQALFESSTNAKGGSVLRISRLDFIDATLRPEAADESDGFVVDDGVYEVTWSVRAPAIQNDDEWCDPDRSISCAAGERLMYPLHTAHLAGYDLPEMGDGAHVILVDAFTPYSAPASGTLFGLGFFDHIDWSMNLFAWPRNINGLTYVAESD